MVRLDPNLSALREQAAAFAGIPAIGMPKLISVYFKKA
jgi:hypothetical protein